MAMQIDKYGAYIRDTAVDGVRQVVHQLLRKANADSTYIDVPHVTVDTVYNMQKDTTRYRVVVIVEVSH